MQIVAMTVPGAGRHHPGQRVGPGRRGGVLPGRRPDQGDRQRAELHERGLPAGADVAAVDHRPVGDGPAAGRAGRRSTRELRRIIDEPTEGPWGVRVERVEIKDVSLPEGMKRSMSRQAEAERERRARIITADGEYQASKRLAAAASVMAKDPAALQLRLLQTVVEVAAREEQHAGHAGPGRAAAVLREDGTGPGRRRPVRPPWPTPRPDDLGATPRSRRPRRRSRTPQRPSSAPRCPATAALPDSPPLPDAAVPPVPDVPEVAETEPTEEPAAPSGKPQLPGPPPPGPPPDRLDAPSPTAIGGLGAIDPVGQGSCAIDPRAGRDVGLRLLFRP